MKGSGSSPDVNASVAIFPADYNAWINSGMVSARARLIDTAPSGAFDARNLLDGDYLLAAVDGRSTVEMQDPKVIAALARNATRVTIHDAETRNVTLTVTPFH